MDDKFERLEKTPVSKFSTGNVELSEHPPEHVLRVNRGRSRMLIPGTRDYPNYDGLETVGLASCTGVALYIPDEQGSYLLIGHLMPSQNAFRIVEELTTQLREANIDPKSFVQRDGFMQVIPGQTTLESRKQFERDRATQVSEELKKELPRLKGFSPSRVKYWVLRGHQSSRVRLLKDGNLIILGEGKAY